MGSYGDMEAGGHCVNKYVIGNGSERIGVMFESACVLVMIDEWLVTIALITKPITDTK